MRVLHVAAGLAARTGGVASAVVEAALGLEALGADCAVWATDLPGPAQARRPRGVRAEELPAGADRVALRLFRARHPYRLAYAPELGRAARREVADFDVVHVHSLWLYPQLAALAAARRAGVPAVVSPHGTLDPALRARGAGRKAIVDAFGQRRLLASARMLHFTSVEEARLAADVAPAVERTIAGNAVDLARYASGDGARFRREHLHGFAGPVVLSHGRLARKKQLHVLVHALASLPDVRLVLAGPDDEGVQAELELVARDVGVADRVTFTGLLGASEVSDALAAASAWALPSLTENFAIAAIEALAAGVPVIVSPEVNLAPDLLRCDAAVVADATGEAFGRELRRVLGDAGLAERGRRFAERYDREAVSRDLARMYAQAAAGRLPIGEAAAVV